MEPDLLFLPPLYIGVLSTAMRYAGPQETVFHAVIRQNDGCTHFIVGRGHAGVADYYGVYDAHELARQFVCDGIVPDRTCPLLMVDPSVTRQIIGTEVRSILLGENACPPELMRPLVVESLKELNPFIKENSE